MLIFLVVFAGFVSIVATAVELKYDSATVWAQVIETPYLIQTKRSINSPYAVQYHFQLPGSKRWYRHWELMLRGEPVASVTKQTWEKAKQTGMIKVLYWRHDPNVNLPADPYALNGIVCPGIAGTFCGLMALACGVSFIKRLRNKLASTPHP